MTGASSGIGKEFSRQLAANGLNVVLVTRRLEPLRELGQDLEKELVDFMSIGTGVIAAPD